MEDKELFRKYRETGDVAVRNEIVEKYIYIASVLAKKFVGRGVEYDDLYQVAALALVKGVERFDETKGLQFSTYITPTITGEIKNYFRDRSRLVRLPRKVSELRVSLKKTADEFFAETGRNPTAQELAKRLAVTEEDVVRAAEAGCVVSLDRPAEDDENGMSYYDVISSDEDDVERLENRDEVLSAVSCLTDEEREILRCRFTLELSQVETARRLNVSQMYVSRMERKILSKLKDRLKKSMAD